MNPKSQARVLPLDIASITLPPFSSTSAPTISDPNTLSALQTAAHELTVAHDVVAFPTETVYGLGAHALIPRAVRRIFAAKRRPPDNPLIVHVSSRDMLLRLLPPGYAIPHHYEILMKEFWPGALTLLFPANEDVVPKEVTAGQGTVGVRAPAHPAARALIALADAPLAAPSANTSGKPSPTRAEHVCADLGSSFLPDVDDTGIDVNGVRNPLLILNGGACAIGLESTVVDGLHPDGNLRVLRPGGVTVEALSRALSTLPPGADGSRPRVLVHKRDYADEAQEEAPTTPGMKYRHYAPSVPVVLLRTQGGTKGDSVLFGNLLIRYAQMGVKTIGLLAPADTALLAHLPTDGDLRVQHFALGTRDDAALSCARLFDGLLTLERDGAELILLEEIPEEREGLAFMNRARKAAGEEIFVKL